MLKRKTKILIVLTVAMVLVVSLCSVSGVALTEDEVQQKVDSEGREAVTGNLFIWFLCSIAFLKISQKIDSFMSALGINVGHTGGSMLTEALIAMRGFGAAKHFAGRHGGGSSGGSSSSGSSGGGGFMKGGLAGVVSRRFTNNAMKNATGGKDGGFSGTAYNSSVSKGGSFANRVIGNIATGSIASTGTIKGDKASAALLSYLGYTALGEGAEGVPSFSDVEIGGGRMMATETSAEHPEGIAVGMYHTDKYAAPDGEYTTVTAADGSTWYKQYAVDTVERTPYEAPDGSVAYHESIVKKLPKVPPRKDKL